jgi:hypothetical protein
LNSADINQALKQCRTVASALTMLGSVGVQSGTLRITGDGARGWIVFKDKKIIRAVVAETAQIGPEALSALVNLEQVGCIYLAPAGEAPSPRISQPHSPMIPNKQLLLNEDELRVEVFGRDPRSEFNSQNSGMLADDQPVPRSGRYAPPEQPQEELLDSTAKVLARTGFRSDFVDAAAPLDPWKDFHGDPANQELASVARAQRGNDVSKYWLQACLFVLCMSIYVAPMLIWNHASASTRGDLERKQLAMVSAAVKNDVSVPVNEPFTMPQGGTNPQNGNAANANNPAGSTSGGTAGAIAVSPAVAAISKRYSKLKMLMDSALQLELAGKLDEALKIYKKALADFPQYVQLRMATIHVYMLMHQFKEARVCCMDGLKGVSNTSDFRLLNNLLSRIPKA